MFHHGWPLAADDWNNQRLFFLSHGYRMTAYAVIRRERTTNADTRARYREKAPIARAAPADADRLLRPP
jgi:hypothetical protein